MDRDAVRSATSCAESIASAMATGKAVARIVRFSVIGLVLVAVAGLGIVGLSKITPTGFLPEEDQGALFVVVQLPGGASVARTSDVIRQA
jgi:multidrug efflux pump subunit AcrB